MLKHVMGVALVTIGWWAFGTTYTAIADFTHYGINLPIGVAEWVAVAFIYWRWFRGWLWEFTAAIFGAPTLIVAAQWMWR